MTLPAAFYGKLPEFGKPSHKALKSFDFLSDAAHHQELMKGGTLYGFNCTAGTGLGDAEKSLIQLAINQSSFPMDAMESQPVLDMGQDADLKAYTYLLNKAMYILPGVGKKDMTPKRLASQEFQKSCQPGTCKVWTDCVSADTFRLTKTLIRAVYKVTIQFKCTWVADNVLPQLAPLSDGLPVHHAILMERTKRDPTVKDSTVKVRSLLLYHNLAHGMLVTNFTVVANSSIPSVVARMVDKLGWAGAAEVAETAKKTRAYLLGMQLSDAEQSEANTDDSP
eukprot:TRINITY_DN5109_c0_g1_i1.p1 TRINITY_DN5109_c0_g1~~TRINITY_DN5109_c0_g1_i1.p1  ORF type:complete len:298 (+),score=126.87 TRINITY_DN5109_c0_g1_i1:56-895(+)